MTCLEVVDGKLIRSSRKWIKSLATNIILALFVLSARALNLGDPTNRKNHVSSRRNFLSLAASVASAVTVAPPSPAFSFGDGGEVRIQKELCIVNVLRLQYWAQTTSIRLAATEDIEQRKKAYLEARLGAKAMVAKKQKVGGGATPRVFTLLSLKITQCLKDLTFYAKNNKRVAQLQEDLIESLASIVEFDGLETTQDPSPRSSLTLGQFNDNKAMYVQRILSERITPLTDELISYFGPDTRAQCESYIRDYYANELPPAWPKMQESIM